MPGWLPLFAILAAAPPPSSVLFERGTPAFALFGTADGLPQNSGQALAVDEQGHLWIGTQGGLAVREGRSFRAVALPGEKAPLVTAIAPAKGGVIWVGSFGDGVFVRRGGRWEKADAGLPSASVRALTEAQGAVWAGTSAGLARLLPGASRWEPVAPPVSLADPSVAVLYRTADPETLWAGTESGLLRFVGGAWTLFDRDAGLPDKRVRSLLETQEPGGERVLWIGTEGGLAKLRAGHIAPVSAEGLPAFPIYALAETRDALWVATYGGGVAVLRDGRFRVFDKRSGLPGNLVLSILPLPGPGPQQLWIGCDEGVARYVEGGFLSFPDGPPFLREKSYALAVVDDGPAAGVWVASDAGLFRFGPDRWTQVPLPVRNDDRPYSFLAERSGALLVGTEQGQIVRIGGNGFSELVPLPFEAGNSVRSMAEVDDPERGPELWVARRNGLIVRRGQRWIAYDTSSGLKGNWHFQVATTPGTGGRPIVWVGGWSGLSRFDGERFTTLDHEGGLPADVVMSILPVTAGGRTELWLSSGAGAVRFDPEARKVVAAYSRRSDPPLPHDTVYTIRADGLGRRYLCTENGIVRLTPRGDGFSAFVFGKEDGLPSADCLERGSALDSSGRLWVAMGGGLAVLDSRSEPAGPAAAKPLVLERSLVRGEDRELEGAVLAYRDNAVQFEYALLSNFRDGETRYRSQLVGVEEAPTAWTAESRREFPTLPSGSYELRVDARDYRGVAAATLVRRFSVARPLWLSAWALALYAVALAGAVYGIVAGRTRSLRRTAQLLEEKVEARTRELRQANSDLAASQRDADQIFSALAVVLEGKVLDGRYRLEETIGSGGFGAVYRATDVKQDERVAVKVFRPQAGNQSTEALARFLQEARSTQQIHHRNSVAVLDSGVCDGVAYTVMELLEGRSLKEELAAAGPLPAARAVGIAVQVLSALAEAHRKGIVHRDIKPENVFLHRAAGGELVKVLDFGIARTEANSDAFRLTLTGAMVGTPVYMAPERLQNKPYDGRSDVYATGILLYEMLVGQPPFTSKDGALWPLVVAHVKEAPAPPRERNPAIPEAVSAAVLAALAKDPLQRPTAEGLAALLDAALQAPALTA